MASTSRPSEASASRKRTAMLLEANLGSDARPRPQLPVWDSSCRLEELEALLCLHCIVVDATTSDGRVQSRR